MISKDPQTHGAFFCPIIISSNKTTVLVGTSHIEYWLVYISIGNIHNSTQQVHQNGLVLLGFLSIVKSKLFTNS